MGVFEDVAQLQLDMAAAQTAISSLQTTVNSLSTLPTSVSGLDTAVSGLATSVAGLIDDVDTMQSDFSALELWQETVDNALVDSGWIDFTMDTGWTNPYPATDKAQYRKVGKVVYLRGLINGSTSAGNIIGNLPAGYRPGAAYARYVESCLTSGETVIQVNSSGNVSDNSKTTENYHEHVSLYGVSFVVAD